MSLPISVTSPLFYLRHARAFFELSFYLRVLSLLRFLLSFISVISKKMASGWDAHAKVFVEGTGGDTAFVFCPQSGAVWGRYTRPGCAEVATEGSIKDYLPKNVTPGMFPDAHLIDGKRFIFIMKDDDFVTFKNKNQSVVVGPCSFLNAGVFVYSSETKPELLAAGLIKSIGAYTNN